MVYFDVNDPLSGSAYRHITMPVNGSEDQVPSSFSSPASAALTPGGTEENGATGGSVVCSYSAKSQGSEAAAAYPVTTRPGEGNSGELCNTGKRRDRE